MGRQARWVWVGALLGSLLLPLAVWQGWASNPGWFSWSVWGAGPVGWAQLSGGVASAGGAVTSPAAAVAASPLAEPSAAWFRALLSVPRFNVGAWLSGRALVAGWLFCSGAASLVVLASFWRLGRARAGWHPAVVEGVPVLVSAGVGPAALGVVRGAIVIPAWALGLEDRLRRLMLLHEAEHLRAGDPRLLLAGLFGVVLMPWNPVLWWQLRRLRQALELDCDARVLRREPDARTYGLLLLEVGRRRYRGGLAVAGLAEPRSFLERRIIVMGRMNLGVGKTRALGGAAFSAALVFLACEAREPTALGVGELGVGEVPVVVAEPPPEIELPLMPGAPQVAGAGASGVCATYIVDGSLAEGSGGAGWTPARLEELEIESIEVVKGSAAAMLSSRYPGVKPGCGVILVTTKG